VETWIVFEYDTVKEVFDDDVVDVAVRRLEGGWYLPRKYQIFRNTENFGRVSFKIHFAGAGQQTWSRVTFFCR